MFAQSSVTKAAEIAGAQLSADPGVDQKAGDRFGRSHPEKYVAGAEVNGEREHRLPNTTNIAFGRQSEGALMLLDERGICCVRRFRLLQEFP